MSAIWTYFKVKEKDATKAICLECQKAGVEKEFARGANARTMGTSNLRRHIQSAHSDKWKELELAEKKRKEVNRKFLLNVNV